MKTSSSFEDIIFFNLSLKIREWTIKDLQKDKQNEQWEIKLHGKHFYQLYTIIVYNIKNIKTTFKNYIWVCIYCY